MTQTGNAWLFFVMPNEAHPPGLIVRRNGPTIQTLTENGWSDRPSLLSRFIDGDLDQITEADAKRLAHAKGRAWTR